MLIAVSFFYALSSECKRFQATQSYLHGNAEVTSRVWRICRAGTGGGGRSPSTDGKLERDAGRKVNPRIFEVFSADGDKNKEKSRWFLRASSPAVRPADL